MMRPGAVSGATRALRCLCGTSLQEQSTVPRRPPSLRHHTPRGLRGYPRWVVDSPYLVGHINIWVGR
eukprot:7164796-Prymnesium_polylepis.1